MQLSKDKLLGQVSQQQFSLNLGRGSTSFIEYFLLLVLVVFKHYYSRPLSCIVLSLISPLGKEEKALILELLTYKSAVYIVVLKAELFSTFPEWWD